LKTLADRFADGTASHGKPKGPHVSKIETWGTPAYFWRSICPRVERISVNR